MPSYQYVARDQRGNAVSGTLAAPNPEALADQLRRMGYLVTRSHELAEGASVESLFAKLRRVSYDDLVLFNVQLSKLIQVGIPLVTALDTLMKQTDNPKLRRAIGDVARKVEGGTAFSEALASHPSIFSRLFINMVRSGEVSGKLDDILRRLAAFAKRQAELRQQLKTAMTYPTVLLLVGCGAVAFLLTGIIPKFMKIFLEANVPLPLPTLILHQMSQLLRHHWLALLGALAAAGFGIRAYVRTPAGRSQFDTVLLKVPVVGDLARKAAISRVASTLETLFSSGVPILEALAIAAETCGNTVIAGACLTAQTSVREGGSMSDPLRVSGEFPPMVVQMVVVGESSGTLDHMLGEVAEHYDELIQYSLKRLTALIEPFFLIVMGGMVAFIMASVLLPLFRMINVIK
jgi:type IV pilus assembly protein PilC